MSPLAPSYTDLYETGDACSFPPVITGSPAGVSAYTFDYRVTSTGDGFGPFRTVKYEFWLQSPTGSETLEATTFERELLGTPVSNNFVDIRFGGSADIPLTLSSGQYRVKLVVNYQFTEPPIGGTRLKTQLRKSGGSSVTRFDQTPPPQFTSDIVVDEVFACFTFVACQKINSFSVSVTPNGDFISANVTPTGNYQFSWSESANPSNISWSQLNTNVDNSVRAMCTNTNYRLTTFDQSNGCTIRGFFHYDGTFNPDADLFFNRYMCDHPQTKYLMDFVGFQGSDVSRIQSVRWDFGDGSSQVVRIAPQLGVFHTYPSNNPPPQGTCYEGWYELTSTNGCVTRRDNEVCFEECSAPARLDNDLRTETTISPNPVSGMLNVKLRSGENLDYIEILNVAGQAVYKEKAKGEETKEIDMSNHSTGIYFVKVKNTEGGKKLSSSSRIEVNNDILFAKEVPIHLEPLFVFKLT